MRNFAFSINKKSNQTIGVVGGGQLARMLAQAANKRDIELIVQTGSRTDSAVSEASGFVHSDIEDLNGTKELASKCKCLTFENEWIDIDSFLDLELQGTSFIPSLKAMTPLVDKISQRKLLNNLNIPCPDWVIASSFKINDLELPTGWRFPLMAKSGQGGYDGKGTKVINDFKDLKDLLIACNPKNWLLERWVDYKKELALVISRDMEGKINSFPLTETYQYKQVCNWVLSPADVSHQVENMAFNVGASLLRELDYVGVLAIEFFFGVDGLLVNEIAPRTHNSAHFTIDVCTSSQFDQQVCIAAGLSAPQIELKVPGALMINLLGLPSEMNDSRERLQELTKINTAKIHWYAKDVETPGRKLGHLTLPLHETDKTLRRAKALDQLRKIRSIWPIYVPEID